MEVYFGVVESRADPLQLGRCKVRVIGVHTEDTKMLPTADLPWATPLMPCNSASTSGIGHSPTGIVEGSWVAVFFRDGMSLQEPVIMGTIYGKPEETPKVCGLKEQCTPTTSPSNTISTSTQTTKKTTDSNVLKQVDKYSKAVDSETGKEEFKIGAYTGKMESKGNVGSINLKDVNGAAYGTYQLHSGDLRDGKVPTQSTLLTYIRQSEYKDEFAGLTPGTKEFGDKWTEIAGRDPQGFENSQREFMVGTQYNVQASHLKNKGIDLTQRGNGVQELIFTTATQYGNKTNVIEKALEGKNVNSMTDDEIVETVNNYKIATVDSYFVSSSSSTKKGCVNRWKKEKEAQKAMNGDTSANDEDTYNAKKKASGIETPDSALTPAEKEKIAETEIAQSGVTVPTTIATNTGDGFKDPFGMYPKKAWLGEPETPRLSRAGNDKVVTRKNNALCRGVGTAGGGSWSEPKSVYAPKYPLNHVFCSESGHVMEFDDTPNAERIHIFHRAGSFVEFHPNGDIVYKSVKNSYDVTISDKDIYVGGDCNITVLGDANIYSKGSMNLKSEENLNIQTRGNLKMTAGGNMDIIAGGTGNFGSCGITNIAGSKVSLNGGWKPDNPDFDYAEATRISMEAVEKNEIYIEDPASSGALPDATPPEPDTIDTDVEEPEEKQKEQEKKGEECPGVESLDASTKLSKYYKLASLTTACCFPHTLTSQLGLTKCDLYENLSALATNVCDHVYENYNGQFLLTSGFRVWKSGKTTSQHYRGEAADFQFSGKCAPSRVLDMAKTADEIAQLLPAFDQMILENWTSKDCEPKCNGTVLHISYKKGGNNRNQKLYSANKKSYRNVKSFYNFVKGTEK